MFVKDMGFFCAEIVLTCLFRLGGEKKYFVITIREVPLVKMLVRTAVLSSMRKKKKTPSEN